jgi:hypothetical protein
LGRAGCFQTSGHSTLVIDSSKTAGFQAATIATPPTERERS